jgi:hypothetical protein
MRSQPTANRNEALGHPPSGDLPVNEFDPNGLPNTSDAPFVAAADDHEFPHNYVRYYLIEVELDDDVRADIVASVKADVAAGLFRRAIALDGKLVVVKE